MMIEAFANTNKITRVTATKYINLSVLNLLYKVRLYE